MRIEYERDASLRAYEVVFSTDKIVGLVVVEDKWMRERDLSLGLHGTVALTLMTVFTAFWTGTWKEAGLRDGGYVDLSS